MSEKDKQFDNVVKAFYPPLLYFMITLFVEVIFDLCLFFKQAGNVTEHGADFLSSYQFLGTLQENLEKYTYLITLIGAAIAGIIFGILYIRECSLTENTISVQFRIMNRKNIFMLVCLGIFGSTGLGRLVSMLPLDNVIGNYETTSSSLLRGNLFIQILSLAVIVPLAEELIYRGLVFTRLRKFMDVKVAMVVASVLFGVFHFNLLQGTYAFLLSMLLICVYMRYQSIFGCVIIHSVANLVSVLSTYFGISEFFNRNMILYVIIMAVELAAAAALFLMIMNNEKS